MLNLLWITNSEFEEEEALYDVDNDVVILSGDYYHTKINDRIDGFLEGLDYANIKYNVQQIEIDREHELFKKLGFYER